MSVLPLFSHIYVEEAAQSHPRTARLLQRYPKATLVPIHNYKEVFNRPRQRWEHQRQSLKLILAVRRDAFLYPGSSFVPNFKHEQFFYTTPVLNCLYNCEYCYLQGLLPSANMVAFINSEDFLHAAHHQCSAPHPSYICISYDTDLLAIEDIFGYCSEWIDFTHHNPHITVEIRTKSANIKSLRTSTPTPNTILAWTLSPDNVIQQFEHKTPSLESRLKAIAEAQTLGWRVRLCFDPILQMHDWKDHYHELVQRTFSVVDPENISEISLGVFRVSSGYLRTMQEQNPRSSVINYPYVIERGAASYSEETRSELVQFVSNELRHYIPQEKICPVPWQS